MVLTADAQRQKYRPTKGSVRLHKHRIGALIMSDKHLQIIRMIRLIKCFSRWMHFMLTALLVASYPFPISLNCIMHAKLDFWLWPYVSVG